MKRDNLDDPGTVAADARDNRRAVVVVTVAAVVVAIASAALMATQHNSPEQAAPRPAHTSAPALSVRAPAE